jgi:hypothetical protein
METMFNYYSLDECVNTDVVLGLLNDLKNDGKIIYNIDADILKLEDIDLEEKDIKDLEKMFDDNDVYPYLDLDGSGDDGLDEFDYDDNEDDDY